MDDFLARLNVLDTKLSVKFVADEILQLLMENPTSFHKITGGLPQGAIFSPTLYLLFTADIPKSKDTLIATFADDTAILTFKKHF